MGLNVSHDCWDGSYGSFNRFRSEIAKAAGWPTAETGHGVDYFLETGKYPLRNFQGWWDEDPADILDVLLVHSDCDGYIFPQHTEWLAKRLDELAPLIEDEVWRGNAHAFARGLRRAAEENEIVVFR